MALGGGVPAGARRDRRHGVRPASGRPGAAGRGDRGRRAGGGRRDVPHVPQRPRPRGQPLAAVASTSPPRVQHADVTEKMIRKLRAGQMPPAGSRRPAEAVLDALADALEAQADARAVAADARPPHVPAAEPRRVRALDPRSARARHQRRRLPAARHQERQLRQHRRRAAAVADADAGVSDRGRRDQPAGRRRSRPRRRAKPPTRCRAGPRSGSRSRARRTARAAACR